MVRWQIESLTKDFLPRLGSPITHIVSSRDASLTATCQADNGTVAKNCEKLDIVPMTMNYVFSIKHETWYKLCNPKSRVIAKSWKGYPSTDS